MMITMIFTLMKMANVTTLNWWWVIIALLVDLKDEIGFWLNPYFIEETLTNHSVVIQTKEQR